MSRRKGTSAFALLLATALIASLVQVGTPAAEADTWTAPRYVRSISGMGRPGVFSWGAQHNPVTDEVLVGDYLHFQVRRYDTDGNHLGEFWRENAFGQPYSLGVDPRDGAIYVAELKDNPLTRGIAKYDKDGNFLYAIRATSRTTSTTLGAFYPVWLTVGPDGDLWVIDSHLTHTTSNPPRVLRLRFDDADQTFTTMSEWPVLPGSGAVPRMYGIGLGPDGTVYLSDAFNRRAYRYTPDGELIRIFAETVSGGDNRGITVNPRLGRVYLVDAQYSDVDVFNLDGDYLFSFGSQGTGPGQFAGGGRQITFDDQDNVWAADFGGFRTLKFSANGQFLLQAPEPPRQPPPGFLGQPRDVAVDEPTGDVWVADAWNQRFQRFAANGAFLNTWGFRGPGGPYQMNYPRSIGIDPVTRRVWVANERGHHIQVYTYNGSYVTQVGRIGADNTDPGNFRWPVDLEFYGRRVIIGDRVGGRVKIFDADTYQELLQFAERNHGTAVHPETGLIYVLNTSLRQVRVFNQEGELQFAFGSRGNGPGQFQSPADAVFANGVLYVTDEQLSNVQAFLPDGTFLGRWGEGYGTGPYQFRNPVGIAADPQGRLYITDSANDRIQVFDPSLARQFEPTPPTVAISAPVAQSSLPLGPVTLTGSATDNVAVANIEIAVRDHRTGLWWNASNSSWEAERRANLAAWTGAVPSTAVNWRWVFHGVSAAGEYVVEVAARDHSENLSNLQATSFAMPGGTPPPASAQPLDIVAPSVSITAPTNGQQLPLETVTFEGAATDDVAIDSVRLAIRQISTGRWWNGSSFVTTFHWHEAALAAPEATETAWSWNWDPPAQDDYSVLARALDTTGNESTNDTALFTISDAPPPPPDDTAAPQVSVSSPAQGQSFPLGIVPMSGQATDDTAVAQVRVAIRDNATNLWWNGSGWAAWSAASWQTAALASPGEAGSEWSYSWNAPAAGNFGMMAQAIDTAGNLSAQPWRGFTVTGGASDTTAPTLTMASPAQNQSFPPGNVPMNGSASDNVAVSQVRIAIRDNSTNLWWNGSGWAAWSAASWHPATLASPGAANTTWSLSWPAPAAGSYGVLAQAGDSSGNLSQQIWRAFTVN